MCTTGALIALQKAGADFAKAVEARGATKATCRVEVPNQALASLNSKDEYALIERPLRMSQAHIYFITSQLASCADSAQATSNVRVDF